MKLSTTCAIKYLLTFLTFAGFLGVSEAGVPTVYVMRSPIPMVAGQSQSTTWATTNATSLAYNCTAFGTGFSGKGEVTPASGGTSEVAPASAEWIKYPSTCIWTAIGQGGSTVYTESVTTVPMVVPPQLTTVWNGLISAFNAGNTAAATSMFIDKLRYQKIIDAIGSEGLKRISINLSEIIFTNVSPPYASGIVIESSPSAGGGSTLISREITFILADGVWSILEL